MRASYSPQSGLRRSLEVWLLLSELHPIVYAIEARVLPMRFEPYRPNVAYTFLVLTNAVPTVCSIIIADSVATVGIGLARCQT